MTRLTIMESEFIPCTCQHIKLLNQWYNNDHQCVSAACRNTLCLLWANRKDNPQFNKATYFAIQKGIDTSHQAPISRPHVYLELNAVGDYETIIHHACGLCIEDHPLRSVMGHFPKGMKGKLMRERGGLHRQYETVPVVV